jgi:hypothetical protein
MLPVSRRERFPSVLNHSEISAASRLKKSIALTSFQSPQGLGVAHSELDPLELEVPDYL